MSENRERQALIVIDVQDGFKDAAFWGVSSNLDCGQNIRVLLREWKARDLPIIVVRHDSSSPTSPLHPDQPGNRLMSFVSETVPDLLVTKHVNSAFYGDPALHDWLQGHDKEKSKQAEPFDERHGRRPTEAWKRIRYPSGSCTRS
ncbi:cysteine hydrolase family protein [Cryobacterium sp. Y82]|uniref:cysteine hydrolase family protein n=1 Tax=Cryobacterium sp. Y82 TaxID=2045017 RepID=UPI003515B544